jgi:hypothetical protein
MSSFANLNRDPLPFPIMGTHDQAMAAGTGPARFPAPWQAR